MVAKILLINLQIILPPAIIFVMDIYNINLVALAPPFTNV